MPRSTTARNRFASAERPAGGPQGEHLHVVEPADRVPPASSAVEPVGMQGAEPAVEHDPVARLEHAQPQRVVARRDREQGPVRVARRRTRTSASVSNRPGSGSSTSTAASVTCWWSRDRAGERRVHLAVERALGLGAAEQREPDHREHDPARSVHEPRRKQRRDTERERGARGRRARVFAREDAGEQSGEREQQAALAHSDGHEVADLAEAAVTDAGDAVEVVDAVERTVAFALVDDRGGQRRPDAGQALRARRPTRC